MSFPGRHFLHSQFTFCCWRSEMDKQSIEKLDALLDKWNQSGLGRLSVVAAEIAEMGLASIKSGEFVPMESVVEDPLMTPSQAAKYLGISPRTLVHSWDKRHGIESSGTGKSRRYALSELNRIKAIIQGVTESECKNE